MNTQEVPSPDQAAVGPDGVLLALVDELTRQGHYAASTMEGVAVVTDRFERFCRTHRAAPFPADETTVLAFLESQRPGMGWNYAKSQLHAIAAAHELAGQPRPNYPQAKKYLQSLLRDDSVPGRQPKVAALTEDEVESMVAASQALSRSDSDVGAGVAGLRAAVALARVPGADSWRDVAGASLVGPAQGSRRAAAAGAWTDEDRLSHAVLAVAAQHDDSMQNLVFASTLARRVTGAGRRAGLRIVGPADVQGLNTDDYEALLHYCDLAYERILRDWTYLTVGISGALRHISLANLRIEDVAATNEGYVGVFRYAKLRPGQVLVKEFRHLGQDPATCADPLCPACALGRQLETCRRRGRASGPLLGTYYGGRWRSMTSVNGRLRLLATYESLDPQVRKRVATRSLRSTAATWAFREGMSLHEIAEYVTNHADVATCHLYIRIDEAELEVHPRYT